MDSKNFDIALENYTLKLNDPKRKSWEKLAQELGYGNGNILRKKFDRECTKRNLLKTDLQGSKEGADQFIGECNDKAVENEPLEKTTYQEGDGYINIICSSPRIITKEDVIKKFNIDTEVWKIKEFTVRSSEGYRKDRSVQWKVVNGEVVNGEVNDSGKLLIAPMFHTETKLVQKTFNDFVTEENINKIFENLKAKDLEPKKISYNRRSINGKVLIIPIADLHIGLLSTIKTVGSEYNLEIAERLYFDVLNQLFKRIEGQEFEEIVLVLGNDFMNSDNLLGTTTKGTQQDNATFWFEIFDKALEMIIKSVNSLLEISKVNVYNVTSNHDSQSLYAIMKAVEYYYKDNPDVWVDTSCLPRKYYRFGKNVIGFTHDMQIKKGLEIMTTEAKEDWSECKHFCWMLAHLHTGMVYEKQGHVEMYRLPTISGASRWSNNSGYIQTERKSQAFVLDEENGIETVMNIMA